MNLDMVYSVSHITLEGETISARDLEKKQGGKGLNQAVALARAGADVSMAGCVGEDGRELVETLQDSGVDTGLIREIASPSGHAIIQLDEKGANAIIVYGGANDKITPGIIDEALEKFSEGDYVLLQNEISNVDYAIHAAKKRGLKVAFNPSPISEKLMEYPLDLVDVFILNEIEGQMLSGLCDCANHEEILDALQTKFPGAEIVMTLGSKGVSYSGIRGRFFCPAKTVKVVDTTGAGDTFCGYFLACILKGVPVKDALEKATKASALSIGKKGAAPSIPTMAEVESSAFC